MEQTISLSHIFLTILLLAGYGFLGYRFVRKTENRTNAAERVIAKFVRVALLLLYLSGLLLSTNFRVSVHRWHHIASLLPIAVLLGFQVLPYLRRKENTANAYGKLFIILGILVLIVSITSFLNIVPQI